MATEDKFELTDADLAEAKRYVGSSGNCSITRSYFKETHSSVENAEMDSGGLYCLEKLVRLAFIQEMKNDPQLGAQTGFMQYLNGLINDFESTIISDWRPERSAKRICDFMVGFYNLYNYQWKRRGRSDTELCEQFVTIMQKCLDFAYMELSKRFDSLPKEIEDVINEAFFYANSRIEEWHEEISMEIPAA
ncbi:MAG: hypothetical protein K6T91_07000 [Firmicutes bacterium]|nr:hypothetical protein [Bacillota bacterium]